jgi:hypothetical protein
LQNYTKLCYKKTHSKFEWENCYEKEKVLLDISLTTYQRYIFFVKKVIFFKLFFTKTYLLLFQKRIYQILMDLV